VSQYTDLAAFGELRLYSHEMIMMPRLWSALAAGSTLTLSWAVFPFKNTSRSQIPDEPGVYAFLVAPGTAGDLNVSYLMYIGETDRTLRERFAEYLREAQSDRIRPKLLRILPLYPDHLLFACAPLPPSVVPRDIESALLEAFLPPGNDQVPASLRRPRKAF